MGITMAENLFSIAPPSEMLGQRKEGLRTSFPLDTFGLPIGLDGGVGGNDEWMRLRPPGPAPGPAPRPRPKKKDFYGFKTTPKVIRDLMAKLDYGPPGIAFHTDDPSFVSMLDNPKDDPFRAETEKFLLETRNTIPHGVRLDRLNKQERALAEHLFGPAIKAMQERQREAASQPIDPEKSKRLLEKLQRGDELDAKQRAAADKKAARDAEMIRRKNRGAR
jgi:hypothetical protein